MYVMYQKSHWGKGRYLIKKKISTNECDFGQSFWDSLLILNLNRSIIKNFDKKDI